MATTIVNTQLLSTYLLVLGISGFVMLVVTTALVMRHYGRSPIQSHNWRLRNWRLKQLTAVACLFFLAMAASYWVIQDAWGWIYLLVAFKAGTWWFRRATSRGT
jgi:multisubunit Na+/H+ antiporter MnhB subunit